MLLVFVRSAPLGLSLSLDPIPSSGIKALRPSQCWNLILFLEKSFAPLALHLTVTIIITGTSSARLWVWLTPSHYLVLAATPKQHIIRQRYGLVQCIAISMPQTHNHSLSWWNQPLFCHYICRLTNTSNSPRFISYIHCRQKYMYFQTGNPTDS